MFITKHYFIRYPLPVVVWAMAIFAASSLPMTQPPPGPPWIDKLVHFTEYFILGLLLVRLFLATQSLGLRRAALGLGFGIGALYGLTDELHQLWVPLRVFEPADLCADAVGSLAGSLAWTIKKRDRSSRV